jgi:hypothetical protein
VIYYTNINTFFKTTTIYNKKIMKKMIISEEEKNRILEMHKDATKRHYLGEQTSPSQSTTAKPSMWTPQLGKTIVDIMSKNVEAGREYFVVPQTPTMIYQQNNKTNPLVNITVYAAQTFPTKTGTVYPPAIVGLGSIDINPPSAASGPAGNQMGTAYSITTSFYPKQYPGNENVWPDFLPKEMVTSVLTAAYNKLDDAKKQQIQQYVQTTQNLPEEYKQLIQGLSA